MSLEYSTKSRWHQLIDVIIKYVSPKPFSGEGQTFTYSPTSIPNKSKKSIQQNNCGEDAENLFCNDLLHRTDEIFYSLAVHTNFSTSCLFVSPGTGKLTGYVEEGHISDSELWENVISMDDIGDYRQAIRRVLEGETVLCRYRIRHSDSGVYTEVEDRLSPVRDDGGKVVRIIGSVRKVEASVNSSDPSGAVASESLESLKELKRQRKFLDSVIHMLPVEIAVFDQDHRYLFVNPTAVKSEEMRKWMIGRDDFDYVRKRNIDIRIAEKRRKLFNKAVKEAQEQEWIDEHVQPDGSSKFILRKHYPYLENDRLQHVVGYGIDITNLKNAEAEREKLLKELGDRMNELMQFNSIVSHNLRAPVASIIGLSDLLDESISEEDKDQVVEGIRLSCQSMDRVLQDLTMILETRSSINDRREKVSLSAILKEIRSNLMVQIEASHASIKVEIEDDADELLSIKTYIHSILFNLISNAIKYKSGNTAPVITLRARKEANMIALEIEDNGLGIDLNKYGSNIFGFYKRFHQHVEGQGLGLFLTKTQVESLGGTISVDSAPGKGSIFKLSLPAQPIEE